MCEVTITKTEYELLIRDSERVRIIERMMLSNNVFMSDGDIRAILGLPEVKSE